MAKSRTKKDPFPKEIKAAPKPSDKFVDAAAMMKGWAPASETLDRIESVRTVFPKFNEATKVGGLPVRRITTVHGPTHGGKANDLDSKILTPRGWRRFGDLKPGDIVTGKNGKPTTVTGFYLQGEREMFRVTMSDGGSTITCGEHLWFTTTRAERNRGRYVRGPRPDRKRVPTGECGQGSVKTLFEIMKDELGTHEIPTVEPVEFEPIKELVVHPYVLGLLLGDGILYSTSIRLANPEPDIRMRFAELQHPDDTARELSDPMLLSVVREGTRGCSRLLEGIRMLNLDGKRSHNKFIPKRYLMASIEDRIELLRGLIDSDGHVHEWGTVVEYTTISDALAGQVVDLVRGLGGHAACKWRTTQYTDKEGNSVDGKPSARIMIRFNDDLVPVSSEKHLARWRRSKEQYYRTITGIESAGLRECACISVDADDHLYVTDDHIVTHNTAFVLGLVKSFVDAGHVGGYVDAEFTLGQEFADEIVQDLESKPNFVAHRPASYEETIAMCDEFLKGVAELRKDHPEIKSILVIDSINKLTPKRELDKLLKEKGEKGAAEMTKGHQGRYRAAVNQAWLDHMTPLVARADCALVLIAQEREDPDADAWARDTFKVKGGAALGYDSSLMLRVLKSSPVFEGSEKTNDKIIGFKHNVKIWKSKVGHMVGRFTLASFHLSNGRVSPMGLDTARDAIEMGKELDIIKGAGAWIQYRKNKWNGTNKAVKKLAESPEILAALLDDIATAIDKKAGRG
jgi:RecA/RadA recombinase